MTSAKVAIKALLDDATNGVKVYDDAGVPVLLTGHVYDRWVGKGEFAAHQWVISISPVIGVDAQIASLGSFNKLIRESVQLDVWVMEKRGKDWAAEKTRQDLVQEVDRCLLHYSASPGAGFMHVNASGWRELDEPGMRRSSMTVDILYEKVRT